PSAGTAAAGSYGDVDDEAYAAHISIENCATPCWPVAERRFGSNPDETISCAATRAGVTCGHRLPAVLTAATSSAGTATNQPPTDDTPSAASRNAVLDPADGPAPGAAK